MRFWFLSLGMAAVLLLGCYDGPAPESATDSQTTAVDPHAGLPAFAPGSPPASNRVLGDSGGPIELDAITLTAPAGWGQVTPSSSFVAAEFTLPRAEGDEADGRLTISTAGGTVEANIDRWKAQFDADAQQPPPEEIDVAGMNVTIVDLSGQFKDQRGPFAPAVERPGFRMIAAILPVDGQLHFIKATGPEKTLAKHADEIQRFIRTAQQKQ